MLAIQSLDSSKKKCTPNIVPCRIHHNGPTKVTKRYWAPSEEKDGAQTAYFRGRKLRGRAVKLPANYQGIILKTTGRNLPQLVNPKPIPRYDEEDDFEDEDQEELPEPVKILEQISTFDELLVWGHDQVPSFDDPFIRNIEEWIGFAEAIHGSPENVKDASNSEPEKDAASK